MQSFVYATRARALLSQVVFYIAFWMMGLIGLSIPAWATTPPCSVRYYVDGSLGATETSSSYSYTASGLAAGSHSFYARRCAGHGLSQ